MTPSAPAAPAPAAPAPAGASPPSTAVKPRLRGVLHEVAAYVAVAAGFGLVLAAPTAGATVAVTVYAVAVVALFGVSALFHRRTWGPAGRRRMRRADHSTIFVAIAGSYTAVGGLALTGTPRTALLVTVWVGAAVGIALRQLWLDAPKWVVALPYVVVGWSALLVLPPLFHALRVTGSVLLLLGGIAYSAGAVVYAAKRPNPVPGVFGYHEVFHACTLVGAALHYVVIAGFCLPLVR
ncbi:MAG: hemolysin III family protein [Actinomycetota bacterium]|nr:hemolysin III family protein [Actinomycetota bacterium]